MNTDAHTHRRAKHRVTWIAGAFAALLSALAGCDSHISAPPVTNRPANTATADSSSWNGFIANVPVVVGHALKPSDLSPTELKYGIAPKRVPSVVYQDGIVLLENGDKLVRAAANDGIGWTLDAGDARVAALKAGDVVFATSRCVGRVLSVAREGNEVKLLLGPVQITDLVKQGNFSYEQPLDLHSLVVYSVPDYPGAPNSAAANQMPQDGQAAIGDAGMWRHADYYVVEPDGIWTPLPAIGRDGTAPRFIHTDVPVPGVPGTAFPGAPPGFGDIAAQAPPPTVDMVNGMQMYACSFDCGGLGLKLYQKKAGVQVWINAIFHLQSPTLVFHLSINSGAVNAHVELRGGVGFSLGFDALAAQDMQANLKEIGVVPVDLTIPLGGMGVPLTAMFQQSLNLGSGFSAKTSVLHAVGDFSASGAILMDYVNGHWNIPPLQMTLKNNLASAISGVSVGINSLVFAIDQRLLVGVGALGFAAGPFVNLISNITALKQASQAVDCRQGTFGMQLGGGIGYAIPKVVAKVINFFLGLVHVDPVPASGFIVRLKDMIPLVDLRQQIPEGCAGK